MLKTKDLIKKFKNNRLLWPMKILVTGAVIYLVNRSLSKDQLPALISSISAFPASIACILGLLGFYCQVKRWNIILDGWAVPVSGTVSLRTMLWGCLLAFITPGRAGEFFRGFSLPGLKKSDAVFAVLFDKLFAGGTVLASGVVCCAIALLGNRAPSWRHWVIIVGAVAVMIAAGAVFAFRSRFFVKRALDRLPAISMKRLNAIIFYSLSSHMLLLIQTALLLSMFGSARFIDNVLACGQAYSFMLFFPFFIANMGIREYSFGIFLGCTPANLQNAGLSAVAFGASMGILAINIILPALIGLAWWIVDKKRVGGLVS
jgi:hypothetical protein